MYNPWLVRTFPSQTQHTLDKPCRFLQQADRPLGAYQARCHNLEDKNYSFSIFRSPRSPESTSSVACIMRRKIHCNLHESVNTAQARVSFSSSRTNVA